MDVFCGAREIENRFARYVIDLRRLFLFHGLACGQAENFVDLAVKLEESRALRLDLPALLRNVRDLEQGEISADEMLTVVALASGGEQLVDGRASAAGVMRTVGLLRMMLAGVGAWAATNGSGPGAPVVDEVVPGVGIRAGGGEDRVFLELAVEELRLQLDEVRQRMRDLGPPAGGTPAPETTVGKEGGGEGVGEDGGRTAEVYGVMGEDAGAGSAARVAAVEGGVERDAAVAAAAAEQEAAAVAAVAAAELESKRRAVEEEAVEREAVVERARTWPLEERVSSLPAMPRKKAVVRGGMAALKEESPDSRRGRSLRMGAIAAGLLLAMVGIYGSLRSASAGAEKESPRAAGARVGDGGGGGAAAGGSAAGVSAERGRPVAFEAKVAKGSLDAGVSAAPAPVLPPKAEMVEKPRVAAAAGSEGKPRVVASHAPAERTVVAADRTTAGVVVKNRRDDAAVDDELARRQKAGRFLYLPAEVMEKYLVSARKPVSPAGAQGRVVLNAFIAKDGTVSRTDVVEGQGAMVNAAMAAVSWRRYRPFLVRGEPAEVVTPVVVTYGGR